MTILAVDDRQDDLALLERILASGGYGNVVRTSEAVGVPELCRTLEPDLLLLDLQMPQMDGFEILAAIGDLVEDGRLNVLVVTGEHAPQARHAALAAGARDFLTKPLDASELLLRVGSLLHTHQLQIELERMNRSLEERVRLRTAEVELARVETLRRLALAAEYRDDDTHEHAQRIGNHAAALVARLGLPPATVDLLAQSAPLHDIGKIAIPDAILLKPGRLTEDEFTHMKRHAEIGARMLSGSQSMVLRMAEEIALTHHEHWDGSGYPRRLAGEAIPLTGRIVALADVFDALTHERPYKAAWPEADAVAEIERQRGAHFDPRVTDAFSELHAARG